MDQCVMLGKDGEDYAADRKKEWIIMEKTISVEIPEQWL